LDVQTYKIIQAQNIKAVLKVHSSNAIPLIVKVCCIKETPTPEKRAAVTTAVYELILP